MNRFYPLRGLPQQRQIWSWISFDVANQSFTLLINTLLFSIFFQKVVVHDAAQDDLLWNLVYSVSMLLVVIASPVMGAISDERACKKTFLLGTGLICAALTCCLGFIRPGQIWLAALLYVPANFMYSIGENFLASFLPALSPREHLGRVSGFSWAVAYSGSLTLLILTAAGMKLFGLESVDRWRPFFILAGLWFFAFALPPFLFLKENGASTRPARHGPRNAFIAGFHRLAVTAREVTRFRDLAWLLVASLFYGAGMTVITLFAGILAVEFGFSDVQLLLFVAVLSASGVVGTMLPTWFQDRIGHKRSTLLLVGIWIVSTMAFVWFAWACSRTADPAAFPRWPLWLIGNLFGFGMGSLGSANRAFVGYLTPASRSGEFFGIWGLVFKLAAVLTVPFGYAKDSWGTTAALVVLLGFLIVGFIITLFVNERRGFEAAQSDTQVPSN